MKHKMLPGIYCNSSYIRCSLGSPSASYKYENRLEYTVAGKGNGIDIGNSVSIFVIQLDFTLALDLHSG